MAAGVKRQVSQQRDGFDSAYLQGPPIQPEQGWAKQVNL